MTIDSDAIARARAVPIEDEAARRGIKLRGTIERCGPCPICGGTDRFSINTRQQIWNCRGCSKGGDVIGLVQHVDGVAFADAIETLTGTSIKRPQVARRGTRQESPAESDRRQASKASYLWLQRWPIKGSPAETYLRERGYDGQLPATLGYLEPSKLEYHPAMIGAFCIPDEPKPGIVGEPRGAITAVHLTLLKPDGTGKADVKPNKIIVGSPAGRPIVLAPPNDLLGLAITEGIEDALTAHAATGLGAWAAGAAGFMPKIAGAVPDYIEAVTIYAHQDKAGQDGARNLADVLSARGVEVFVEGLFAQFLTDREVVALVRENL